VFVAEQRPNQFHEINGPVVLINESHGGVHAGAAAAPPPLRLVGEQPPWPLFGRAEFIENIEERLLATDRCLRVALTGGPGIGKTSIAVALAHRPKIRARYPNVLQAGLGPAANCAAELGKWLFQLTGDELSPDPSADVAALRSKVRELLRGRPSLFILDDVWTLEHWRAFHFEGFNDCAYVLTTRRKDLSLMSLVTDAVPVPELGKKHGRELLRHFAKEISHSERKQVGELVDAVDGLPLALVLIGSRLAPLDCVAAPSSIAEELSNLIRAVEEVDLADPLPPEGDDQVENYLRTPRSLKAAISMTVERLDVAHQVVLYGLSLFAAKPHTFTEEAYRAVTGAEAKPLEMLIKMSLVEKDGARFCIHRVISRYAAQRAAKDAPVDRLRHMRHGMVRYYQQRVCDPTQRELHLDYPNIVAALEIAADERLMGELLGCLAGLEPFLARTGLYASQTFWRVLDKAEALLDCEIAANRMLKQEHLMALTDVLLIRTNASEKLGRFEEAHRAVQKMLTVGMDLKDMSKRAEILHALGLLKADRGQYTTAGDDLQQALALLDTLPKSEKPRFAKILRLVAEIERNMGRFEKARSYLKRGLDLVSETDRDAISAFHLSLGGVAFTVQDYEEAERQLAEALPAAEEESHRERIAAILHLRAAANLRLAVSAKETNRKSGQRMKMVADWLSRGLRMARAISHQWYLIALCNECGELHRAERNYRVARRVLRRALHRAGEELPERRAFVLYSWAKVERDSGNLAAAIEKAEHCLQLFVTMRGHFMEPSVRGMLEGLQADFNKKRSRPQHAATRGQSDPSAKTETFPGFLPPRHPGGKRRQTRGE
jgi:tetratricopeptide (TPR) repeat protein